MKTARAIFKKSIFPTERWIVFLILTFFLTPFVFLSSEEKSKPLTAILGAFPEEARILKNNMSEKETYTFLGVDFVAGKLEERNVIIALTGVGKVNAAMTTTLLLDHFRPSEVIFTGIAGGINPKLMPGDIVIAEKLAQHDLGYITSQGFEKMSVKSPVDGKRNPTFIPSDSTLVALAQYAASKAEFGVLITNGKKHKPKVVKGILVTGDVFVASRKKKSFLAKEFGADAVEMEGAAVAQVCFQQGVPFVVLRSISDQADQSAQGDIQKFHKIAAKNSAILTIALIKKLKIGY